jgi:hypothetical protein
MSDRIEPNDEVPVRDESRSSRIRFFSAMEQRIGRQFSGDDGRMLHLSKSVGSLDTGDIVNSDPAGNECDYEAAQIARIMRNSFDVENNYSKLSFIRPKSAGGETGKAMEFSHHASNDMGHLSRRIWMGSDGSVTPHERSFGHRNTFNRSGSFRSHRISPDDLADVDGQTSLLDSPTQQQQSGHNPIVVSPYMVSRFISTMIHRVMKEGVTTPERSTNNSSPEKIISYAAGEAAFQVRDRFEPCEEDYTIFKRNASTVVTSEVRKF